MGMTMDEFDRCIDALLADLMKSSTSDWATIDKVIEDYTVGVDPARVHRTTGRPKWHSTTWSRMATHMLPRCGWLLRNCLIASRECNRAARRIAANIAKLPELLRRYAAFASTFGGRTDIASSRSRVFRFLRRPSRPSALHPALASRAPVRVYLFIYIQKTDIAP